MHAPEETGTGAAMGRSLLRRGAAVHALKETGTIAGSESQQAHATNVNRSTISGAMQGVLLFQALRSLDAQGPCSKYAMPQVIFTPVILGILLRSRDCTRLYNLRAICN